MSSLAPATLGNAMQHMMHVFGAQSVRSRIKTVHKLTKAWGFTLKYIGYLIEYYDDNTIGILCA
jgi:hypothetical protein